MKKGLTLLSTFIIFLSGCSKENIAPLSPEPGAAQEQISSAQDLQLLKNNKNEINSIAGSIFSKNFADGLKSKDNNSEDITKLIPALKEKGPLLFKLLNKDKKSQDELYPFSDEKVGAFLTKPSKPDNTPPITQKETKQLLALLKPGDLILCGNDDSFIHAILYIGNNIIIHSLASKGIGNNKFLGVIREPLNEYLTRSERDKFVILRYKKLNNSDLQKAINYATRQIGKSYDTLFLPFSDTRFYCTELVFQSLMHMDNKPQVFLHKTDFGWEIIRNEEFMASPDFETVWTLHYTRPPVKTL